MFIVTRVRALTIAALTVAAGLSAGCSWFGGGGGGEQPQAIRPQPATDAYRSPLRADPGRTGDFRREGLLARRATTPATRPATQVARAAPAAASVPSPLLASTRPTVIAPPQYLVLGSVVANVNGSPIYANEVLQLTAPLLRARARDLDAARFRQLATRELKQQRDNLIKDELEYAAAQRNTNADEAREAAQRTYLLRERLVSQAGGSLEMARSLAREEGNDFDTMLAKQERQTLVALYYRKKIFPRVSLTVDEMRRYYEQNLTRSFTTPATATLRVVRVDVADAGGDAQAQVRIEDARRRLAGGENPDAVSDDFNRSGLLRDRKGLVGPVSKGSYAIAELDDAVWRTPAGRVTPAVRSGNAYYVALVSDRAEEVVRPFDDAEVQRQITDAIRNAKIAEIQTKARDALQRDAVIQADEEMLAPAVEMSMQLYPAWHDGAR